jgi:hypothetical protein
MASYQILNIYGSIWSQYATLDIIAIKWPLQLSIKSTYIYSTCYSKIRNIYTFSSDEGLCPLWRSYCKIFGYINFKFIPFYFFKKLFWINSISLNIPFLTFLLFYVFFCRVDYQIFGSRIFKSINFRTLTDLFIFYSESSISILGKYILCFEIINIKYIY